MGKVRLRAEGKSREEAFGKLVKFIQSMYLKWKQYKRIQFTT